MSLKDAILSLQQNNPCRKHIECYFDFCHKIAMAYLEQKVARGSLNLSHLQTNTESLALDCIAGLFQYGEQNKLAKIARYYQPILASLNGCDGLERLLEAATRKLVMRKVNDELYLANRKADPGLAKMRRNLIDAIKAWNATPKIRLMKRFGRQVVCFAEMEGPGRNISYMTPEILEIRLVHRIEGRHSAKQILENCVQILLEEEIDPNPLAEEYSNGYPLTELALAIFRARARAACPLKPSKMQYDISTQKQDDHQSLEMPDNGYHDYDEIENSIDCARLIDLSVNTVQSRMHKTYVDKQKLDGRVYKAFFRSIDEILTAQYIDGIQPGFLPALQSNIAGLTGQEYAARYRTTFEYLFKLTRETFQLYAKKFL